MRTCNRSTPFVQVSEAFPPPPRCGPRRAGLLRRADARWLASLHPWAGAIVRSLGVREQDIGDVVLGAFARVAARWATFAAPDEVPPEIARRRWIAHVLFLAAAEVRASRHPVSPRRARAADPGSEGVAAGSGEGLLTAPELRRQLRLSTAAVRWRVWIAYEVDATPVAEIARQERRPPAKVRRLLEHARTDLAVALDRQAAA